MTKTEKLHRKAMESLLYGNYVNKTSIMRALKCNHDTATKVFAKAKEIDKKKSLIDARPQAVQSQTVLKVAGLNYNYIKKQYESLTKEN